ncbi:MAG: LysM peptidoglycan-binding domain-containing protein [Pseudomonadota bacterium]
MSGIHTIASGQTLSGIASMYNVSLDELLAINSQIDNANIIFAGQTINVPGSGSSGSGTGTSSASDAETPWFQIAKGELGTDEIPGARHNRRILEYHATTTLHATTDEVPWCSSFVNWCIVNSGIQGTNSAAARSWMKWGSRLSTPTRGCIVVYSSSRGPTSGHVGFFERIEGSHIITLGGNQSDSVNYRSYPASRLLGYRWPSS